MTDPGRAFFDSITEWKDLQQLIDSGEAEGQYLECKAPTGPQLTRDLQVSLGDAISGFANTSGGVVIWGIQTTRHPQGNMDVLSDLVPIGNCRSFAQQIAKAVPKLAYPTVAIPPSKVIHEKAGDHKGIVLTYIPPTSADPIQSLLPRRFYLRSGDEFVEMPYEILRRMFAAVSAPDLAALFADRYVAKDKSGAWIFTLAMGNRSSAPAEHVKVLLEITNPSACAKIEPLPAPTAPGFNDVSAVNPGRTMFTYDLPMIVYRGLNQRGASLSIVMRPNRFRLSLSVTIFAYRMRAKVWDVKLQLAPKKGFSVKEITERYVY